MRQLVYTILISNNHASFHIWWKENLLKHQKVWKYHESGCRPLTEMKLSIQALPIAMGKPIRNVCLGTVKYDWKSTVWQWGNRKYFLFVHGNIWNFKVAFYNKTTCLLRCVCFSRGLLLVSCYSCLVAYLYVFMYNAPIVIDVSKPLSQNQSQSHTP